MNEDPGVHKKSATHFCNPDVVTQSWYVAGYSRKIRRGQVKSLELINRRIAIYRDSDGRVHALDGYCSHLGADLGQGKVCGDQLECAYHHWRFGPDGQCHLNSRSTDTKAREIKSYPTLERWGLIWIFNGPTPTFTLPNPPSELQSWPLRFPVKHLSCHPHLVIGNGLDATHFNTLHNIVYSRPPKLTVEEPNRVRLSLQGRPRNPFLRWFAGCRRQDIEASFMTIGSSLAWLEIRRPDPFHVLFAGRPTWSQKRSHAYSSIKSPISVCCDAHVVFLLPRGTGFRLPRILFLVTALLGDDSRILNTMNFRPHFAETDEGLMKFAEVINSLKVW